MSYTPVVNGDVKGPTAATIVEGLFTRPINPANPVPAIGNAYIWDGVQWTPGSPTTAPGTALAASIIFRPAVASAGNHYQTWPEVMTAFNSTDGTVSILVDGAAAAIPAGAYNMQGRATLSPFQRQLTAAGVPVNGVTVADGGIFSDLAGIDGPLQVTTAQTAAAPFQFTALENEFFLKNGALITDTGTFTAIAVANAGLLRIVLDGQSKVNASGGTAAIVTLAGTGECDWYFTTTQIAIVTNAAGFISGGPTSTANLRYDATLTNIPASPGMTGTLNKIPLDDSTQVTNIITPYTVDVTGGILDRTIFSNVAPSQYNLPSAAANPGRKITFKDITGTAVIPVFQINPTVTDHVETGGAGASFQYPTPFGSVTLQSDGGIHWWII